MQRPLQRKVTKSYRQRSSISRCSNVTSSIRSTRPLKSRAIRCFLTKMRMHFFELEKLPAGVDPDDMLLLLLALFKSETKEDIARIKALEVPVMEHAISAYESIVV